MSFAFADSREDNKYFTFGEAFVSVEESDVIPLAYLKLAEETYQPQQEGEVSLDQIIVIGKQLWAFIVENQPVLNLKTDIAHLLPEGINAWNSLSDWNAPKSYIYKVEYKNGYGIKVVEMKYNVLFTPGGSYNGKGQYLANVTILPRIDVSWGYTVDAAVNIHQALNAGTAEDPIAMGLMDVSWKISTVMKKSLDNRAYAVRGDGEFQDLN